MFRAGLGAYGLWLSGDVFGVQGFEFRGLRVDAKHVRHHSTWTLRNLPFLGLLILISLYKSLKR